MQKKIFLNSTYDEEFKKPTNKNRLKNNTDDRISS